MSSMEEPDAEVIREVMSAELTKRNLQTTEKNRFFDNRIRIVFALPSDYESILGVPSSTSIWSINEADEGFELSLQLDREVPSIYVFANRLRAHLYGIGHLLGNIIVGQEFEHQIKVEPGVHRPHYSLRGHQLGYRDKANSWDAWTVEQFDNYIRDLALLGSNAIEDIPFQSEEKSTLMILPHWRMHQEISKICAKYDIAYWVWTPAVGDLSDRQVVERGLSGFRQLFNTIPHLEAIFFPGGDPGDNHPKYVIPYLEELYELSRSLDREVEIWISLQGFDSAAVTYFFRELKMRSPSWLTGLVHGPSSPPIALERQQLPEKYKLRLYGDITHSIRCQYPVDQWDQAYALTLGREPINPEPQRYRDVFIREMSFADGFISYSDGVHDDVNKVIWNKLGWNPNADLREILRQYAAYFFFGIPSDAVADGILALEHNWKGPLSSNESVETTLRSWQKLHLENPQMKNNWRWVKLLFRAYYDAYIRRRLIYEEKVEREAMTLLGMAPRVGVERAIDAARLCLMNSDSVILHSSLADSIRSLADDLFNLIKLQSSVSLYQASGFERGAVLDFMNYPLNNRWWLADEFLSISKMNGEEEKLDAVARLVSWDRPGEGGYYDNISHVNQSPHVISQTDDAIDFAWWENGKSRQRLSTQIFQFTPTLKYQIDPKRNYVIRVSGFGEALLRANGVRLNPYQYDRSLEGFKEFKLPAGSSADGVLVITFDRPDEQHLNWRQYSKVSDVWVLLDEGQ